MCQRLASLMVCVAICGQGNLLFAIVRSWDDEGGTADKNWSNAGNWSPDGTPQLADDIFIGNLAAAANDTTILDQSFTITSLTLSNGADVDTSGNELIVNGVTTLGGAGVNILVDPGPTATSDGLDSQGIVVNADAILQLLGSTAVTFGGVVELESGQFEINAGGAAGGHGTIELMEAVAGQVMENSGRLFVSGRPNPIIIQGPLPGTLTIHHVGTGSGTLDLDGDGEAGVVDVDDGNLVLSSTLLTLVIEVPLADAFGGQMDIGNGDTVNIAGAWTMDSDGILNFNGTTTHTLTGGALTVNSSIAQVNANAGTTVFQNDLLISNGTFNLANDAAVEFNGLTTFADALDFTNGNNTTITVNTTVDIGDTPAAGEDFNWDGGGFLNNHTIVNAAGFLIITVENVDSGTDDTYNGKITMNSGNIHVEVADGAWVMDGVLNLNNSAADMPLLSGDSIQIGNDAGTLNADVNVGGTGSSRIAAPITFMSDADVDVAAGATLELKGNATFNSVNAANNAQFTGGGILELDGASNQVNERTTIDMPSGRVDLDGTGTFAQTLTLGIGALDDADLTLNVAGIDAADNSFGKPVLAGSDSIVLNGDSDLFVNLTDPNAEWMLNSSATLQINACASLCAGIHGSDFNLAGTANISGDSQWDARTDISGTVNVAAGSELSFTGGTLVNTNRLEGGTITGDGTLVAVFGGEALVGFGTINTDIDFNGGAELRADDGTLTVNAPIVDVGVIGTADTDGVLNVTNPWSTFDASVELLGGRIEGADITNAGGMGINGFGDVTAAVNNITRIDAEGGTLRVTNPASDWDGNTNNGSLTAVSGTLVVVGNATFPFNGTVAATSGEVFANGFELEFEPASDLILINGIYHSTHATDIGGTVLVGFGGPSTIDVFGPIVFENTSNTTLSDDLVLGVTRTDVQSGATFTGGGDLINLNILALADGANVGVLIENQGILDIGAVGTGRADAADFVQTATGQIAIDLGGTALSDFDRLVLSGGAQLDGHLGAALFDGFSPALGDMFTIISATGGVSGTFVTLNQPAALVAAGLMFDVVYNPTLVQLVVANFLPGDYNQNGTVDAADYVLWRNTLGQEVWPFNGADGNGDGIIDSGDYDVWTTHFGQTAGSGSGAATNAAVPEPASIVLLLATFLIPRLRRVRAPLPKSRDAGRGLCAAP